MFGAMVNALDGFRTDKVFQMKEKIRQAFGTLYSRGACETQISDSGILI